MVGDSGVRPGEEAGVRLKVALVALVSAGVVAAAMVALLGDTQARTDDDGSMAGSRQAVSSAGQHGPGGGALVPVGVVPASSAVSDACVLFGAFYALRAGDAPPVGDASARGSGGQTQTSVQRSTTRSSSRVTVNGVVVHDETITASVVNRGDSSGGGQSQSTSVTASTSVSTSGSSSKVTVNGVVIKDEVTGSAQVHKSLTAVLTSVISKRVHFESLFLLNWFFSALAGPGCSARTP